MNMDTTEKVITRPRENERKKGWGGNKNVRRELDRKQEIKRNDKTAWETEKEKKLDRETDKPGGKKSEKGQEIKWWNKAWKEKESKRKEERVRETPGESIQQNNKTEWWEVSERERDWWKGRLKESGIKREEDRQARDEEMLKKGVWGCSRCRIAVRGGVDSLTDQMSDKWKQLKWK